MSIVRFWQNSTFLRHNTIFFFGSLAVGFLNYLYYPVLGRLLFPADFGEVQTLVSLFLQATIFLNVLNLITVNIVANYQDEARRNKVVFDLEKLALAISMLVLLATVIFGEQLRHFLQFDEALPFLALALALVVSVPFTFRSAFLRGRQRFGLTIIANLLGAGGKLGLSVLFVLFGWGTTGAILGIVLAQLIALGYEAVYTRRLGFVRPHEEKLWQLPSLHMVMPELKYAALVLIGSLVITLQFSIDVVIVKHYFDAHTAGLYAGIATVARILFFLTLSVAQVLLPAVKLHKPPTENRALLIKSMALLFVLGGPVMLGFALFPSVIVLLLMGDQYHEFAHLLPLLGLAMFIISILNLLISYYMALRRYAIAAVTIAGGVITLVAMMLNHNTLHGIVLSLLYGSLVMLGLLGLWIGASRLFNTTTKGVKSI